MRATFEILRDGSVWRLEASGPLGARNDEIIVSLPDALPSSIFDSRKARIQLSDRAFGGARKFALIVSKVSGGVAYSTRTAAGGSIDAWMGPFFWDYFPDALRELFIGFDRVA
jgi:hypothetical protein